MFLNIFFSPSEDTKIFYWNCGCAIDQPLLSLLLLNKLCSSAEPSQSNLYNSFQFYELRQAEVGQIEKEEEKSTESELVSILGAGKNKLPGNSFSTKEITNSVQQILKFKGRYIHSHFGQRANVVRPKIFSSCVVGKMMREGGSANFRILQEMTKRLKGFVWDTSISREDTDSRDCYAIHQGGTPRYIWGEDCPSILGAELLAAVVWRILNDQDWGNLLISCHRRRSHMELNLENIAT